MKKTRIFHQLLLGAVLLLVSTSAMAQSADAILGKWLSEKKDAKIEIYKADNGKFYGKLFWGARMYEANGQTSRLAKNGKPFKDMVILRDLTYEEGGWEGGTIYDPEEGKTYACRLKLEGKQLNIRGYMGVSLFGRETFWQRI